MFKRVSLIPIVVTAMIFTVSCASKKAKTQAGQGGTMDSTISSKDMTFDPQGSDSGKIQGLTTVHFDLDSSALSASTRQELAGNADWIKSHSGVTVQIEGHCDKRGSVEYNLALGERRAKAVKKYLVGLGIASKRLTVISYGKEKPLDPADSEEAYAKNRRANFVPLAQ